jgi:hypothetical protein
MEEQPAQTIAIDPGFLGAKARSAGTAVLPRACLAGAASIIPTGQSLIAGYGQGVLST